MTQFALSIVGGFAHQQPPPFKITEEQMDHTRDHVRCPACRAANVALQAENTNLSRQPFAEARKYWTALRAQSTGIKERTHETDANYLKALDKFFNKLRLCDIMAGHLRGYQFARLTNTVRVDGQETHPWKKPAGHSIINHELCVLQQILKHCNLWARLKPYYFPLKTPKWSPRQILSEQDEEEFFKAAAADPECGLAYWVAAITANTSASGIELRGLRLENIFLRPDEEISEIYIPEDAVKNNSRARKIPLNLTAKWAIEQCYKRALKIGCCQPEHYLFPYRDRRRNVYLPERHPSRWVFRRSWEKLRSSTGFHKLKPHDMRFLCITKLLECEVAPEKVQAIAGHVSRRMMEYYSKPRRHSLNAAVMAINPKRNLAHRTRGHRA